MIQVFPLKKCLVTDIDSDFCQTFDSELEAYSFIQKQPVGKRYMCVPLIETVCPESVKFKVSVILTVFERPQRTLRAINSVINQDSNGWELLIIGDNCPYLKEKIQSGYFDQIIYEQRVKGNDVVIYNLPENKGGYGYGTRNYGRDIARGEYVLYLDNDDYILPNHISERLSHVKTEKYDLLAFDTYRNDINYKRSVAFQFGYIGHQEIMVRTKTLRSVPDQTPDYGHDWKLVESILKTGATSKIVNTPENVDINSITHRIMSFPNRREEGID